MQHVTTRIVTDDQPVSPEQWERLHAAYPNPERLRIAFRLAPTLDTCRALLNNEPVDPALLDRRALEHAAAWKLVRFDTTMLDHYQEQLEALRNWDTAA